MKWRAPFGASSSPFQLSCQSCPQKAGGCSSAVNSSLRASATDSVDAFTLSFLKTLSVAKCGSDDREGDQADRAWTSTRVADSSTSASHFAAVASALRSTRSCAWIAVAEARPTLQ